MKTSTLGILGLTFSLLCIFPKASVANGGSTEDQIAIKRFADVFFAKLMKDPKSTAPCIQFPVAFIDGFNGSYAVYNTKNYEWGQKFRSLLHQPDFTKVSVTYDHFHVEQRSAGVMYSIKDKSSHILAQGTLLLVLPSVDEFRVVCLCVGAEKKTEHPHGGFKK